MQEAGYHFLLMDATPYYMYLVNFGEDGLVAPIYREDEKIGEVRKECAVIDDMHIFSIFINEGEDPWIPLLFSCYMYVITYYRPGEKPSKGIQKRIRITKNKFLLSKCI